MKDDRFGSFLSRFWQVARQRYDFIQRMDTSLAPVLPKKSSFYLGVSPRFGKHVIVNFQESKKVGERGDFTINVHISSTIALTDNFAPFRRQEFARFEDGYYRLPTMVGRDRWWSLSGRTQVTSLVEHWVPSSDSVDAAGEATDDVLRYLEHHLLIPAGFVAE